MSKQPNPLPVQHEIARHGNAIWSSDAPDAGPYRIGSPWFVLASFGERVPGTATPGSERQLEAFHASRAVFRALRDLTDGTTIDDLATKTATRVARDLTKTARASGRKLDVEALETEVREKTALVLEAARR